jgi:hypothetical protein
METHWLLMLCGALVLIWGGSLILTRHWTRKRLLASLLEQELLEDPEAAIPVFHPEDQAARELIRAYRRGYYLKLWPDTELSFKMIFEMSQDLIREVARVYYPEEERPELKASLADMVALFNRVGERLGAWLETFPIRNVKDLELRTVFYYHDVYQGLKDHPGYQFVKRHHLDKVARWGWTVYNYANPWHWARKAAYEGGKEVVFRLLLAKITDLVGEEAVKVYGRSPG